MSKSTCYFSFPVPFSAGISLERRPLTTAGRERGGGGKEGHPEPRGGRTVWTSIVGFVAVFWDVCWVFGCMPDAVGVLLSGLWRTPRENQLLDRLKRVTRSNLIDLTPAAPAPTPAALAHPGGVLGHQDLEGCGHGIHWWG